MNKLSVYLSIAALGVSLIALVLIGNVQGINFGGVTNLDQLDVTDGLSVDNVLRIEGDGGGRFASSTLTTVNGSADFASEASLPLVEEGTLVTLTSGATVSITAAQACDGNVLSFAPSVATASATLPTSSAWVGDCLGTNGDSVEFLLRNTSSTSLFTLLAADASTTMVGAATDDQIDAANEFRVHAWRTGTDTLVVEIRELVAAD